MNVVLIPAVCYKNIKTTPIRERMALIFVGVLLVIAALAGDALFAYQAWKGAQVANWPTVEGVMTHVEVFPGTRPSASTVLGRYAYTVDAQRLEGEFQHSEYARGDWARAHPPGAAVIVWYNPKDSADSMLFLPDEFAREYPALTYGLIIGSNLSMAFGLGLIVVNVLRERRARRPSRDAAPTA